MMSSLKVVGNVRGCVWGWWRNLGRFWIYGWFNLFP